MCKLFSTRYFYSKLIFLLHFAKINNVFYKPLISRHFLLPCYDLFGCFLNISTSDLKYGCQRSAQFGHTSFSSAGNRGKSTVSLSLPPSSSPCQRHPMCCSRSSCASAQPSSKETWLCEDPAWSNSFPAWLCALFFLAFGCIKTLSFPFCFLISPVLPSDPDSSV